MNIRDKNDLIEEIKKKKKKNSLKREKYQPEKDIFFINFHCKYGIKIQGT